MRLLALVSLASAAKKYKPTYDDCVSNGVGIEDENMKLQCDGAGKCGVTCDDSFTLMGSKKIKCKYEKQGMHVLPVLLSLLYTFYFWRKTTFQRWPTPLSKLSFYQLS